MPIDFLKRLTPEQKKNILLREKDKKRRIVTVGHVTATDTEGNEFIKTVTLTKDYKVIDFGWPISYYLEDTYKHLQDKSISITHFVIDLAGQNHKGYEVSIPIKDALAIFEKAITLKEKDSNENIHNVQTN